MKFGGKVFLTKLLSRLSHKVCRLLSSPVLLRKLTNSANSVTYPLCILYFSVIIRRKRSKNGGDSKAPIPLDSVSSDIGLDSTVYQTITEVNSPTKPDEVYSNVVVDSPKTKSDEQIYQNTKDGSARTAAKPVYQNITGIRNEKGKCHHCLMCLRIS